MDTSFGVMAAHAPCRPCLILRAKLTLNMLKHAENWTAWRYERRGISWDHYRTTTTSDWWRTRSKTKDRGWESVCWSDRDDRHLRDGGVPPPTTVVVPKPVRGIGAIAQTYDGFRARVCSRVGARLRFGSSTCATGHGTDYTTIDSTEWEWTRSSVIVWWCLWLSMSSS